MCWLMVLSCGRYWASSDLSCGSRISLGLTCADAVELQMQPNTKDRKQISNRFSGPRSVILIVGFQQSRLGRVRRAQAPRFLICRLRNRPRKRDGRFNILGAQSLAVRRHHRGLAQRAASQRNDVLQILVAIPVEFLAIIQEWRNRRQVASIRGARRRRIGVAPNAVLIENAFSLRFLVSQVDHFRRVVPVGLRIVEAKSLVGSRHCTSFAASRQKQHARYSSEKQRDRPKDPKFWSHCPAPCVNTARFVALFVV